MAATNKTTSDLLTRKVWNEKFYREIRVATFFDDLVGKGDNSIIQEKEDFTKQQGDEATFGITYAAVGTGVTGSVQLEGNEEALTDASFKVALERYRHAMRDNGFLTRKRAVYDMPEEMRAKLKRWSMEKIDQLRFDALGIGSGSTSGQLPTKVLYNANGTFSAGTAAAAKTAMAATTGIMDGAASGAGIPFLVQLEAWATLGGAYTSGRPEYTPLQPYMWKGKPYFILLTSPDALVDIKTSANYNQMQRDAMQRGLDNPVFQKADCLIHNILIYTHRNVLVSTDGGGGANIRFARSVLLGCQALNEIWADKPNVLEKKLDYDEFWGYRTAFTYGVAKPKFNSKDYGSLGVFIKCSNTVGV